MTIAAWLVVVTALWLPVLLGSVLFAGDRSRWLEPAIAVVREALRHGELPVWNRYVGLGFSIASDPLYGLAYPPNWLLLWGDPARAQSLLAGLHVALGGFGAMALARWLGGRAAGATVAAAGFALSGATLSMVGAGVILHAVALVPWEALAVAWAARGTRATALRVGAAGLGLGVALTQGEVFFWMMGVLLGVGVAVAHPRSDAPAPGVRARLRPWAQGALAVCLALGVAAVCLLPVAAGLAHTERAAPLTPARAGIGSMHPARLVEFAAPLAFRPRGADDPGRVVVGEPRLAGRNLVDDAYLGAVLLALALMAPGRGRRRDNALAAMLGLALLLALGRHTLVWEAFRHAAPPFARMRFPEKFVLLAALLTALLAARAVARVGTPDAPDRLRPQVLALLLALAAGVAPWALPRVAVMPFRLACLHGVVAALLVAVAVQWGRRRPIAARVSLGVLVTFDLFFHAMPLVESVRPEGLDGRSPAATTALTDRDARADLSPPRVLWSEAMFGAFAPGLSPPMHEHLARRTLMFSTPARDGIATLNPYDAGLPPAYQQLWDRHRRNPVALLRLGAGRWLVAPAPDDRAALSELGLKPFITIPPAMLFAVPDALPRVYLTHRAESADFAATLARLDDEPVLRGDLVYLPPGTHPPLTPAVGPERCVLDLHTPGRLAATCQVSAPALVVFVEQYHPGWQVTVDGRPAPLVPVNGLLRGVAVGPGTHHVAMRFVAPGLRAGVTLSALAVLLGLGLVVAGRLQERARRPA